MRMFIRFYHVNSFYQLMKDYLGRELLDMAKLVVNTTGRYPQPVAISRK